MKKLIYSIILITLLVLTGCSSKEIHIADANLEYAIRLKIDKMGGKLTLKDVRNIVEIDARNQNIKNLSGIEYLINLETLLISFNEIDDIIPLSNLDKLKVLSIGHNNVKDIKPISNLENLKYLYLQFNVIEDLVPLKTLSNLEKLDISANQISEISGLSKLTKLEFLVAS